MEDSQNVSEETITVEELLINCVMARTPLWDSRIPIKERSKTIRDVLWQEIYQEFGSNPDFSIDFLMKKWRNLRDTYVRIKGDSKSEPSGSAAKNKKKWEFFDQMSFLNDTINFRPTVSNLPSVRPPAISPGSTESLISPVPSDSSCSREPSREPKNPKIEGAIIDVLNKINKNYENQEAQVKPFTTNLICQRISDILDQMPQAPRTALEIKLLSLAFEEAKEFLK